MLCTVNDIRTLLPALPTGSETDLQITQCIITAEQEVRARIARIVRLSPTVNCPIFRNLCMYRTASVLLATTFSGSNEQGETRLSEYYDRRYEQLFSALEKRALELLDDSGSPIPAEWLIESTPSFALYRYPPYDDSL